MKFLCIGAGAIGIYVGGSLDLAGNHVGYLIKPTQFDILSRSGFQITYKDTQKRINNPNLAIKAGEMILSGFDILLVAVKSYDTDQVVRELTPYKEKIKCCVCLQNGVDNENQFIDLLGAEKVIYGSVTSAIKKISKTHVVIEKNRGIGLAGSTNILGKVFEDFEDAGLKPRIFKEPLSMKWSKLVSNLFSNATSAILDLSPVEIYSQKHIAKIEIIQIKEALDVIRALGLKIVDLPGVPIRLLAFFIRFGPEWLVIFLLENFIGKGRGNKLPSLMENIRSNAAKTEVGYLNGAVALHANQLSIKAPINTGLTEIVKSINVNPLKRKDFMNNPDYLITQLKNYV
jgi:2-dehydropantoate 2-reductase